MKKQEGKVFIPATFAVFMFVAVAAIFIKCGWEWASVLALFSLMMFFSALGFKTDDGKNLNLSFLAALIFGLLAICDLIYQLILYF
jgi:hypothetical protein